MSDILIKGMEMPTRCGRCDFRIPVFDDGIFDHYECCITAAIIDNLGEKMVDCPIAPIPDHGRLIEAEPIMKFITDGLNSGEFGYDQIKVLTEIQYAPTIIPAEDGE